MVSMVLQINKVIKPSVNILLIGLFCEWLAHRADLLLVFGQVVAPLLLSVDSLMELVFEWLAHLADLLLLFGQVVAPLLLLLDLLIRLFCEWLVHRADLLLVLGQVVVLLHHSAEWIVYVATHLIPQTGYFVVQLI